MAIDTAHEPGGWRKAASALSLAWLAAVWTVALPICLLALVAAVARDGLAPRAPTAPA